MLLLVLITNYGTTLFATLDAAAERKLLDILPDVPLRLFSIKYEMFCVLRLFLIQLNAASRKQPFSTGLFFDWILLALLIVNRVDFIVFVLFLEAVGVREYCCTAVEIGWQLCAPRFLREQRLDEPSSRRVGGFWA